MADTLRAVTEARAKGRTAEVAGTSRRVEPGNSLQPQAGPHCYEKPQCCSCDRDGSEPWRILRLHVEDKISIAGTSYSREAGSGH